MISEQDFQTALAEELGKPDYADLAGVEQPGRNVAAAALAGLMNAAMSVEVENDPITQVLALPKNVTELMAIIPGSELGPMATATWRAVWFWRYSLLSANGQAVARINPAG